MNRRRGDDNPLEIPGCGLATIGLLILVAFTGGLVAAVASVVF